MKYNGIDPKTLHAGISIKKEIPPGTVTSELETLYGSTGEIVAGRIIQQGEYIVRLNIAGKTPEEGWDILSKVAAWAEPTSETTAELIPTKRPAIAYDAVLKEISPPEFIRGFAVIDVVFAVPRPIAHSIKWSHADEATAEIDVVFGGTHHARPELWLIADGASDIIVSIDGNDLIKIKNDFSAGQVVKIYTDTGAVKDLYDEHMESLIDYTETDFVAFAKMCTPGTHRVAATGVRNTALRWRDEWV